MTAIEFYNTTKDFLQRKATAYGVTDLDKYYETTDTRLPWYASFKGDAISRCFAQLAFHGQNATMISGIVRFEYNYDFLYETCCHFNPKTFWETYCEGKDDAQRIDGIVAELRKGLRWNSKNSTEERKDSIAKRFAKLLIHGSEYLKGFATKEELVADLRRNNIQYHRGSVNDPNRKLIKYFMEKMGQGSGFSVALTCDFLKELDTSFNYLAKPDIHIMDVMAVFKGKPNGYYYNSESKAFECLREFQELVREINNDLPEDEKITVYKLDRMIWLICSGKFFLDHVELDKKHYLGRLR